MRKPWWWRRSLIVLAIAVGAFMALPVAHAQQVFVPGAVVALEGTPHLWIADDQGVLHWGGDTRALSGRHINWSARTEVSLAGLRTMPKGDPWLSAGLLKQGDPIYLVKWETEWPQPRLLHIQSIADVEIFGINETNYGRFVLDVATWEARYGISVASLQRGELPPAVPTGGTAPSIPAAPVDIPYQSISGYEVGIGTINLPQGQVTLKFEFGGWSDGPVTVTYQVGGGAPVHLINNERMPYYKEIALNVPQAATYTFRVSATRDWRIWVGLEPGLPSVPLPLDGCRVLTRWHQAEAGIHRASYDCGGDRLDGTSYEAINTDKKFWVVWYLNNKFLRVTSTGGSTTTGGASVTYQLIKGYNGGSGQLTLPKGQVTLKIVYDKWDAAPFSLTLRTPSGEHVRLIDSERISYRTNRTIDIAQAGVYGIHVAAQLSWRLWVGEELAGTPNLLKDVRFFPKDYRIPINGQPYRQCGIKGGTTWRLSDGVYRADYVCTHPGTDGDGNPLEDDQGNLILNAQGEPIATSDTWRGVHYLGLNTSKDFWVIWEGKDDKLRIIRHSQ